MYACKKCGNTYRMRTELLLHASVCCPIPSSSINLSDQLDSDSSEFSGDSDADPVWQPDLTEAPVSPSSSPLTLEQMSVANFAEEHLMNWPSDEQTSVGQFAKDAQEIDFQYVTTNNEAIELELKVSGDEQAPDENTSIVNNVILKMNKFKEKIYGLKSKIDEWKEKRKQASKCGKQSKARRLSKQISKLKKGITVNMDSEDNVEEMDHSFVDEEDLEIGIPNKDNDVVDEATHLDCINNTESPSREVSKRGARKKNYCIYCNRLVSKFSEHLQRHSDTPEGAALKNIKGTAEMKRIAKMKLTGPLRKKWNAIYNDKITVDNSLYEDKKKLILVKQRHAKTVGQKTEISSIKCLHCHGYYRRDKLSVHLKKCENFLNTSGSNPNAKQIRSLKEHSVTDTPCISYISKEFQNEILKGIQRDDIIDVALKDELIMKFANQFHHSRRENSSKSYVIREIRDCSRLLIEMKKLNNEINEFKDCLNPKYFDTMIKAALHLAGYDQETGDIKTHSIAYRLSQPVKDAANILLKEYMQVYYDQGTSGNRDDINRTLDFLLSMEKHWKTQIGRLCTKSKKLSRVDRVDKMALEKDITEMAAYLESQYRRLKSSIQESSLKHEYFDFLMHIVVTHIMLLIRRRPVDFKNARLRHYNNLDKHDELLEMAEGSALNPQDLEHCKNFHIFYVPGKNLEIVPVVLTPLMKSALDVLIKYRNDVGITNDVLFMLSNNRYINPTESLRLMKKQVKLRKPGHLTGNGLRHQAATFSRLHSNHPQYQDFLASALGHTLSVHKKHYDLPLGVLQKIMVCPILHKIMTGKQSTSDVTRVPEEIEQNENSEIIDNPEEFQSPERESHFHHQLSNKLDRQIPKLKCKTRWTQEEQDIVLSYFGRDILEKRMPQRKEVVSFIKGNPVLKNRTVEQLLLYIRNHCYRNQKNVSPKVKRVLSKCKQSLFK